MYSWDYAMEWSSHNSVGSLHAVDEVCDLKVCNFVVDADGTLNAGVTFVNVLVQIFMTR